MPERELFLIDGANEFDGVRGVLGMLRRWPRLRRELIASPGYVAHHVWFGFPTTIGLFTWWESEEALYAFAGSKAHHELWRWASDDERSTRGGWLVVYQMQRGGPLWGTGVDQRVRTFRRFVRAPSGMPPDPPPHG